MNYINQYDTPLVETLKEVTMKNYTYTPLRMSYPEKSPLTVVDIAKEVTMRMMALKEAQWANPDASSGYKNKYAALESILKFIEESQ